VTDDAEGLAITLFAELHAIDQRMRGRLLRALPGGLGINQFSVLHHLARLGAERSPAQLAQSFHVTRGAMTNTLARLQAAGFVHIRPDWEDGRRKWVAISPAGLAARNRALDALGPVLREAVAGAGPDRVRAAMPVLRALRAALVRAAG
jgi:DNA-binding MarR family transcriptional regulator